MITMMSADEILKTIYHMPKKQRDQIKENVFTVLQDAQTESEKRAWKSLCEALENWKNIAELDAIVLSDENRDFFLTLDPDEVGSYELKEF